LKWADVSEVHTASIIRARGFSIALMMEAVHTSETSVYFKETRRRCIPEICHLQNKCTLCISKVSFAWGPRLFFDFVKGTGHKNSENLWFIDLIM
jgi:hypothetical protein